MLQIKAAAPAANPEKALLVGFGRAEAVLREVVEADLSVRALALGLALSLQIEWHEGPHVKTKPANRRLNRSLFELVGTSVRSVDGEPREGSGDERRRWGEQRRTSWLMNVVKQQP